MARCDDPKNDSGLENLKRLAVLEPYREQLGSRPLREACSLSHAMTMMKS
jgi:hypothetical protein